MYDQIQGFIQAHKPCGKVSGTVDMPDADGYSVSVACTCGKRLSLWINAESARHDLIYSTLLCSPN